MADEKKKSIVSQIVTLFYRSKEEDFPQSTRESYMEWFVQQQGQTEKEQALYELYKREKGDTVDHRQRSEALKQLRQKRGVTPSRKRELSLRRVITRVAAIVIPLLVVTAVVLYTTQKPETPQIVTAQWVVDHGQTKNLELPDSTNMKVNAGSRVNIRQDKNQRLMELSGEAYIKVSKDKERPFVVKTQELTVSVLGTEFNIEAYPDKENTIITLTEGSVKIDLPDGRNWTLTPNHQFVYNKTARTGQVLKIENTSTTQSWTTGSMICESMDIYEIFQNVERKFDVKIEIAPSLKLSRQIRYTIKFNPDDTPQIILSTLRELIGNFDYTINGRQIRIIHPI